MLPERQEQAEERIDAGKAVVAGMCGRASVSRFATLGALVTVTTTVEVGVIVLNTTVEVTVATVIGGMVVVEVLIVLVVPTIEGSVTVAAGHGRIVVLTVTIWYDVCTTFVASGMWMKLLHHSNAAAATVVAAKALTADRA